MKKIIKGLLLSDTGKDTGTVIAGTLISIFSGGLFFIIVPRYLGPQDFGIFSTIIATGLFASSLSNFAIDSAILRFAQKENFNLYLSVAFKSYVIFAAVVAAMGLFFSPAIAEFLKISDYTNLLRIAFISIFCLNLTNFYTAALQAKREFFKASALTIVSNVLRLLFVLVSIMFSKLNLTLATVIFFLIPLVSVFLGSYYLKFKFEYIPKEEFKKFHKYNFWLAAALVFSSIPYDNYFLIKIVGPTATGLYSAPYKLLTSVYQLGGNFTRVLASRYSSFDTKEKVIDFSLKAFPFLLSFSFVLILAAIFAPAILNLLLGVQFVQSTNIFRILTVGFIFFSISTIPSAIILYYLGKSDFSFKVTFIKYVVLVSLLVILVPSQKATGAAISFSVSEAVSFTLMSLYVFQKLKK